ncbi:MAG: sulfite exporter TauE/SafE family protein [Vicinamibacteraceae bacterium]
MLVHVQGSGEAASAALRGLCPFVSWIVQSVYKDTSRMAKTTLLLILAGVSLAFVCLWVFHVTRARRAARAGTPWPSPFMYAVGFVTNFFDALGIGSFATTTSVFKLKGLVDDRVIPGTLNVGHALPSICQAFIYIAIIEVDLTTLVLLIAAAVLGAWLGAGIVARWSRRRVQIGMALALLVAASLMLASQLQVLPIGGEALQLDGGKLTIGLIGNFALGALMTLGIGLYAPAMIMVSLLGMSPAAAFPIMMGSCAFLMPVGSVQFIRTGSYDLRAARGLAIGGIPGVLIAAYLVKSLPLSAVRWLVVIVVVYAATMLLRAARRPPGQAGAAAAIAVDPRAPDDPTR